MKILLCIDFNTNWYEVFGRHTLLTSGEEVKVEQTEWKNITLKIVNNTAHVHIKASENPFPFSTQDKERDIIPDFLLLRNFPTDFRGKMYTNLLVGFECIGLPAVNSVSSVLSDIYRPIQNRHLKEVEIQVKQVYGDTLLSVIDMMYFSNINDITNTHEDAPITFPCVVKVSCTNAGFGKSLIKSASELDDLISILSLGNDYYTIEPYLDVDYEVRIQRIGKYTRTFKRQSTTSWKNNWGQLKYEDTPLKSEYVHWCDECQKVFDIELFAVDVLVLKDGREVVIETNNTANGLMWEHEEEDRTKIKEVVLEKMNQVFH